LFGSPATFPCFLIFTVFFPVLFICYIHFFVVSVQVWAVHRVAMMPSTTLLCLHLVLPALVAAAVAVVEVAQ
jgi:hypothetical protein